MLKQALLLIALFSGTFVVAAVIAMVSGNAHSNTVIRMDSAIAECQRQTAEINAMIGRAKLVQAEVNEIGNDIVRMRNEVNALLN